MRRLLGYLWRRPSGRSREYSIKLGTRRSWCDARSHRWRHSLWSDDFRFDLRLDLPDAPFEALDDLAETLAEPLHRASSRLGSERHQGLVCYLINFEFVFL